MHQSLYVPHSALVFDQDLKPLLDSIQKLNTSYPKASTFIPLPPLIMVDPKAEAVKTRVLTHMTKDHSDSLALFLNHYCKTATPLRPTPPIGTLVLDDITLNHICITHPQGRNLIPIDPPMTSLSESRERLVQMHKSCLTALNMAEFKIEKFALPNKAWQWFTHFITIWTFVVFAMYPARDFLPGSGSWVSKVYCLGGLWPGLGEFAAYVKDWVLVGMLLIHTAEAAVMARGRLRRYWVPRFSGTWWAWTTATFTGGVAALGRFDDMVREMEEERKRGGKH